MKNKHLTSIVTVFVLFVFCVFGIDPVAAANSNWYVKGMTYPMDASGEPIRLEKGEKGMFGVNVFSPSGDFKGEVWFMARENFDYSEFDEIMWYVRPAIRANVTNSFLGEWERPSTLGNIYSYGFNTNYGVVVFNGDKSEVAISNIWSSNMYYVGMETIIPNADNKFSWDPDAGPLSITLKRVYVPAKYRPQVLEYAIINITGWRYLVNNVDTSGVFQIRKEDLWACYKEAAEGKVYAKCDGTETGTIAIQKGILAVRNRVYLGGTKVQYIAFGYDAVHSFGEVIVNLPTEAYVGVKVSGSAVPSRNKEANYVCSWVLPSWLTASGCAVSGVPTKEGLYSWKVQLTATGYETLTAIGLIQVQSLESVVGSGGVGVAGDIIRTLKIEGTRLANFVGFLDYHRVNLLYAVNSINEAIGSLQVVDVALDVKKYVSFGLKFLPPYGNIVLGLIPVVFGIRVVMWIVSAVKVVLKWW